mmetsp:Transcript_149/g.274  ORF Transcript_149/g.274 Transcript_149/m.274 type:complete len:91 (-) Transcript_149:193-465(-)
MLHYEGWWHPPSMNYFPTQSLDSVKQSKNCSIDHMKDILKRSFVDRISRKWTCKERAYWEATEGGGYYCEAWITTQHMDSQTASIPLQIR